MRAAVDSIALWRGRVVVGAEGRIGVWQKVPQTILESTFNAHTWIFIGWLEDGLNTCIRRWSGRRSGG